MTRLEHHAEEFEKGEQRTCSEKVPQFEMVFLRNIIRCKIN